MSNPNKTKKGSASQNPRISMSAFFALPEVRQLQEVQKANPFASKAHKDATIAIVQIARSYGVQSYFEAAQ